MVDISPSAAPIGLLLIVFHKILRALVAALKLPTSKLPATDKAIVLILAFVRDWASFSSAALCFPDQNHIAFLIKRLAA